MEFLRNFIYADYQHGLDIISALFGIILCFVLKKKDKHIIYISLIISVMNAYWLGAVFLFRFYYNARSFFTGGIIGIILVIVIHILFKNKIVYVAATFICAKLIGLFCNLFVEVDSGRGEEWIILGSYSFAIIVVLTIKAYLLIKEKMTFEDYMNKILFPIYGSFLITGCWFDFYSEIEYEMGGYLIEKSEYINFYKYIARIDWNENEEAIIFVVMFVFISLVGYVMQNHNGMKK